MITNNGWICTDPDNLQFGRKLSEGHYEFKEFDRNSIPLPKGDKMGFAKRHFEESEFWIQEDIFLAHYSAEKIKSHVSAYYSSVEEVKKEYLGAWEWIVAECIFEQESSLY